MDAFFAEGRMRLARAYHEAARAGASMIEPGDRGNPVMSQVVNAAIAYTDAVTARRAGSANRTDHSAAVRASRDAVGNRLPAAAETGLRRILGEKNAIQYGARPRTKDEADRLLDQLDAFAVWAEEEFNRPV